ncbi:MAG: arginine repressor [Lachnospiraceae bacterium]|nr:arginine repressor [Lachnospiraceae bacterium]MDD3615153.1 arginine repressor [Lachnospiraceae bacterium]
MKSARHAKIIHLIQEHDIETQEELAELLNRSGYKVTQATVSRDIKELKLTKVTGTKGRSIYTVLQNNPNNSKDKYNRVLQDAFVSMDTAGHLLVLKTAPGMAMAVGAAIDGMHFPEVLGCIAGDDTVMCAIRSQQEAVKMMEKIRRIVQE